MFTEKQLDELLLPMGWERLEVFQFLSSERDLKPYWGLPGTLTAFLHGETFFVQSHGRNATTRPAADAFALCDVLRLMLGDTPEVAAAYPEVWHFIRFGVPVATPPPSAVSAEPSPVP